MNIEKLKDNVAYLERCVIAMESLDSKTEALLAPIQYAFNNTIEETIELLENDLFNLDGGVGSGNWGHIGRKGKHGGSAPGGGLAFRLSKTYTVKDPKLKYDSQAKMRQQALKWMNSSNPYWQQMGTAKAKKIDMQQKSYKNVTTFDAEASKHILGDLNLSKSATKDHRKGTAEGMYQAYKPTAKKPTAAQPITPTPMPQPVQPQPVQPKPVQPQPAQPKPVQPKPAQTQPQQTPQTAPNALSQKTERPNNPNYNKAIAIDPDDKNAIKNFSKEAQANAKLHRGDTDSVANGAIQKLVNYMGYDKTLPTVVSKAEFAKLAQDNPKAVMTRGLGRNARKYYDADAFRTEKRIRMGGIMYGTGIYFGTSRSGYGTDLRMIPKNDAKILVVDVNGRDANGKNWMSRGINLHKQFTAAIVAGYDAVRIVNGAGGTNRGTKPSANDYFTVWNRGAFVVEDSK